ncbi:MAG TPA: thioredoxin domain-containing protein [Bryobacteraceae bacterium]|nr:thioredoxin domain-containing protein [Bryobacteraceae bacterium]
MPRTIVATSIVFLALSTWATALSGSQGETAGTGKPGDNISPTPADSAVVARVDSIEIRQSDLDAYAGREVASLEQKLYALRSQALNNMIDARLVQKEASRQHLTVDQLLDKELGASSTPSEVEIERDWESNYDALRAIGEVGGRYQVMLDLESRHRAARLREYLTQLRKQNNVAILLRAPESPKLQVSPNTFFLGQNDAGSELVIFQDYECPFCRQLEPVLESLLKDQGFSSRVKITIKQLPLSMHKGSFDAAVAAVCAGQQQAFPIMHKLLFENQNHTEDGLTKTAMEAGLSMPAFRSCLAGDAPRRIVLADMEEARKNGVQATPSLFFNNDPIVLPNNLDELRTVLQGKSLLREVASETSK